MLRKLSWIAGACACGCTPFALTPVAPHRAEGPAVRAEVTSLELAGNLHVAMRIEPLAPPATGAAPDQAEPVAILHALLAPADAAPCTEGLRERQWLVDGGKAWIRPTEIRQGRTFDIFYGNSAGELLAAPAAIDLVIVRGSGPNAARSCLRLPLTGAEEGLAWTRGYHGYFGGAIRAYFPSSSIGGFGTGGEYDFKVGARLGPARLQLDGGFGTAFCRHDCLGDDAGFWVFSAGPSAHVFVLDTQGFGLDVGLGYRFLLGSLANHGVRRTVDITAPELTVRIAGVPGPRPGLPEGSRVSSFGLELSFAEWRYEGPLQTEHAFVTGLGLSWDAGF